MCEIEEKRRIYRSGDEWAREVLQRENGFSSKGIKIFKERDMNVAKVIRKRERQRLGQWIEDKITRTRYNARYKEIGTLGIPRYLQIKRYKRSQKLIERWWCGNEEKKNRFWVSEEEKKCRIYTKVSWVYVNAYGER